MNCFCCLKLWPFCFYLGSSEVQVFGRPQVVARVSVSREALSKYSNSDVVVYVSWQCTSETMVLACFGIPQDRARWETKKRCRSAVANVVTRWLKCWRTSLSSQRSSMGRLGPYQTCQCGVASFANSISSQLLVLQHCRQGELWNMANWR